MHFGKKNLHYKYKMNEHTLEEVEVESGSDCGQRLKIPYTFIIHYKKRQTPYLV